MLLCLACFSFSLFSSPRTLALLSLLRSSQLFSLLLLCFVCCHCYHFVHRGGRYWDYFIGDVGFYVFESTSRHLTVTFAFVRSLRFPPVHVLRIPPLFPLRAPGVACPMHGMGVSARGVPARLRGRGCPCVGPLYVANNTWADGERRPAPTGQTGSMHCTAGNAPWHRGPGKQELHSAQRTLTPRGKGP